MPDTGPVLVLTDQPIIAALIGLQLEVIGKQPVFPDAGETPTAALQRVRPVMVVLIDVALEAAQSDLLFALAARRGVGMVVFGADHHARRIAEIAAQRRVPWFVIPPDLMDLSVAVDAALGQAPPIPGDRRSAPQASVTPDGAHLLRDAVGVRWMVYDRRSSARGDAPAPVQRVFVDAGGRSRVYAVAGLESTQPNAAMLQEQLEGAMSEG